jgi:hypothetical protein
MSLKWETCFIAMRDMHDCISSHFAIERHGGYNSERFYFEDELRIFNNFLRPSINIIHRKTTREL